MIIYKATNQKNGKFYIGKTTQKLSKRKYMHKWSSSKGEGLRGYKSKFYNAIRKYGFDNFIWEILCKASSIDELNEKEKEYIKKTNAIENGYNISSGGNGGDNFTNHPQKEEIRQKISESLKGRKMSEEFCKQNRERQIGREISQETREKRSKSLKGRVIDEEWRRKISESLKGRKKDPKSVEKGASKLRCRRLSQEHKEKIANANRGRKHSDETKKKISKAVKGRTLTEDWKRKIAESNRGKHGNTETSKRD